MKTVYLSLGSNAGDREEMLRNATRLLDSPALHITRMSSIYETEPQDVRRQPWFLNMVLEAETTLFPKQLLKRVQKVELELGRKRLAPRGPRTIDIDILLFGDTVIETAELSVPHPRMTERRFVLEPMTELSPDLRHPVSRRTMRDLLGTIRGQKVRQTTKG